MPKGKLDNPRATAMDAQRRLAELETKMRSLEIQLSILRRLAALQRKRLRRAINQGA